MNGCKSNFVHWPFRKVPLSLSESHLSLPDSIPHDFHSQILHGCLFPVLIFWAGKDSVRLRPHGPKREPLQLTQCSKISAATCGSRASFFYISALPTSPNVAFFVNPQLKDCISVNLHLFIHVGSSIFQLYSSWSWEEVSMFVT